MMFLNTWDWNWFDILNALIDLIIGVWSTGRSPFVPVDHLVPQSTNWRQIRRGACPFNPSEVNQQEQLQIRLDQLRLYKGWLVGFMGYQVKVWGYAELWTTLSDENAVTTFMVKYIVVNTPSAYNLLLGWLSLNMLEAVPSSYHMKVKLPYPEGKVITMKVD